MKKLMKLSIILIFILGVMFINTKTNAATYVKEGDSTYTSYEYLVKEEVIACIVFWSILKSLSIRISGKKSDLINYYVVTAFIVGVGFIYDLFLAKNYTGTITNIDRFFYVFLLTGVIVGSAFKEKNIKIITVAMLTILAVILQISGHAASEMWMEYAIYVASQLIFLPQYVKIEENQAESKIQKVRKVLIEVGDTVKLKSIDA
jgi:hypothetical protein